MELLRKYIISIGLVILWMFIFMHMSIAKYSIENTLQIGNLEIDRTSPKVEVIYSTKEANVDSVKVILKLNEAIKMIDGWEQVEGKNDLQKIYTKNIREEVSIEDLAGNKTNVEIHIENILAKKWSVLLEKVENSNIDYPLYANKTHEIMVWLKNEEGKYLENTLDEKKIQIQVGDQMISNVKIEIFEEKEDSIKIKISNIEGDGKLSIWIPQGSMFNQEGEKNAETFLQTDILIDNTKPKVRIEEEKNQFAVLIDADNISPKYAPIIFQELEAYGFPSCRRIYGNWSKANGWNEELLLEYSIIPVQQFSYTSGKNATDMAMVIDAMDLLYGKKVDGFCIVTSDSDFTRLAMRLREEHMYVIGMGESKTPVALTRACNKFIHLNLIYEADRGKEEDMESDEIENVTSLDEISYTIADIISENGNAPVDLGKIGNRLNAKYSDFDVRNYGYTKLSVLIDEEMDNFMLVQEDTNCYVEFKELTSRETIEEEVIHFVKKNGGSLDNLSAVTLELKDKHSGFNIKDYGYSRMSSFLRSIRCLTVNGNTVRLKKRREKGERR